VVGSNAAQERAAAWTLWMSVWVDMPEQNVAQSPSGWVIRWEGSAVPAADHLWDPVRRSAPSEHAHRRPGPILLGKQTAPPRRGAVWIRADFCVLRFEICLQGSATHHAVRVASNARAIPAQDAGVRPLVAHGWPVGIGFFTSICPDIEIRGQVLIRRS